MTRPTPERSMRNYPYVDIVDFVERTTYAIWNDRDPGLVSNWYGPHSVIWGDAGSLFGGAAIVKHSEQEQSAFPDLRGVIPDTIWTGDDASGYRTSMRWLSRGTHTGPGPLGAPTGQIVRDTAIANCVVLGDQYVEEWTVSNTKHLTDQLGITPDEAVRALHSATAGAEEYRSAEQQGATVPAIPARVGGAGLLVAELLDGLYNQRDLELVDKRYTAGAPYLFGASRWNIGHAGVRSEVARWLDLLPDLNLTVDELYWLDDAPNRSRVAVRYRITGTTDRNGSSRPVSITGIHHVHVRGDLVVGEWAEYNELALHAQITGAAQATDRTAPRGATAPLKA